MTTKTTEDRLLTDTELEMMRVIWAHGTATAGEVQQALAPERDLAYTSVSTILRILEQKGILRCEKEGRGHRYIPILQRADYESRSVRHLVSNVFEGSAGALVKRMISEEGLSPADLDELQALLDARVRERGDA